MKPKKLKKLVLSKVTISNLNFNEMRIIQAGQQGTVSDDEYTCYTLCPSCLSQCQTNCLTCAPGCQITELE
jgi:hypothetical protein